MRHFISVLIRNSVLVNLLVLFIILLGFLSSNSMVREVFPEIQVDILFVTIPYPGADPEEVEEGISRKVEEAIDGIEGIKTYTTVSTENVGNTVIEVMEGFDIDTVRRDVRNAIDSISTFPVDAEEPVVQDITINDEIILLALWGEQQEYVLKEFAETVKDEIQALPSVSQVAIQGTRDYEIGIELSEERLRQYGLNFNQVAEKVRQGSVNLSGGQLRTRGEEILLRTVGRKYTGEEFGEIIVLSTPEGDVVRLKDIAEIRDTFAEDEVIAQFNDHDAVMLYVFKTPEEDAIQIVEDVRAYVDDLQARLPSGLQATLWSDQSRIINAGLNTLLWNGAIGLAIVFLSLWLFMEIRLSFWVTMGIPISLAGGLLIMYLVGASLNQISLFSLVMVLGIVVDDAIIVGEAIFVRRRAGDGPQEAAVNGVMEVGLPVLAAVTTSILAFLPLGFVGGVLGKFVSIIPVAVVSALVVSLFESLFLLPGHLNHLPEMKELNPAKMTWSQRMRARINRGIDWVDEHAYKRMVEFAVEYRYVALAIAIGFAIITVAVVATGRVTFVLFQPPDADAIIANVEFPAGTPIDVTWNAVEQIESAGREVLERLSEAEGVNLISNVYSGAGLAGGEFSTAGGATAGPNTGFVRIELIPGSEREVTTRDLEVLWDQETGLIPGAIRQTYESLIGGPPGADIHVELRGNDTDTLVAAAADLKDILNEYDGVFQVQDSFRPGKNEIRLDLKPEAQALGITLDDLARQVYAGFYGVEPFRLQRGRDDIRVKVRYVKDERDRLSQLENVRIRTPQGQNVPFYSVADVEFTQGYAAITRTDGQRTVDVTASVDPDVIGADLVLADLAERHLPALQANHHGFTWQFRGARTESRDAFAGLLVSFPAAMACIYLIIATVFRSYVQPMVIMTTIPFGLMGAIYGHILMGENLQMFSIFGMIALTGVVVNDAIVLIEAFNHNVASGQRTRQAIVNAGLRRFRAILLTSFSTVGGLAPLILENDPDGRTVVPMALSLASGVAFATVLTLLFIPCQLSILNDLRRIFHYLWYGEWPTRERVEPARSRSVRPANAPVGQPTFAK